MKIDIFNIDEFVKVNRCQEVTNQTAKLNNMNSPDGVLSDEIFGTDRESRKNTFAYIDLSGTGGDRYIHPMIYKIIKSAMKSLDAIVRGEQWAVLDQNNRLQKAEEGERGAGTGLDFIYKNFNKIKWEPDKDDISIDLQFRYDLFDRLDRDEFFISKWLIIPPYYREESSLEGTMGDPINKMYKTLIGLARSMKIDFGFKLFSANTKIAIQDALMNVYESTLSPLSGKNMTPTGEWKGLSKNAMFRKNLLGKTIDFAVSNVISAPNNSESKSPKDMSAPFGYGCFPIINVVSMFQPFFVSYISDFLTTMMETVSYKSNYKKLNVYQFNNEIIEHHLKSFIKSEHERFKPIYYKFTDLNGDKREAMVSMYEIDGKYSKEQIMQEYKNENIKSDRSTSNVVKDVVFRPMTWTDLIYIAATEIIVDKHAVVTRYPIANFQNISPVKIKMVSTKRERENVWIMVPASQVILKMDKYPIIDDSWFVRNPKFKSKTINYKWYKKKTSTDSQFFDHFIPDIATIPSLNADFDGDTLSIKGLFTDEANAEASNLVYSKKNLFDSNSKLSRSVAKLSKDVIVTAFNMTKE